VPGYRTTIAAPAQDAVGPGDPADAARGGDPDGEGRVSVEIGVIEVVDDDTYGHLEATVRPPLSLSDYLDRRAAR